MNRPEAPDGFIPLRARLEHGKPIVIAGKLYKDGSHESARFEADNEPWKSIYEYMTGRKA